jgi:glycosyltransferase involved in cell wall biosynthesis
VRPDVSVLIPARNEGSRLAPTIEQIAGARTTDARVEFVIVDDASSDTTVESLVSAVPRLLEHPRIDIRVRRLDSRAGIYGARNTAAGLAAADVLFITDAHVHLSAGWDELVLHQVRPNRIVAATTTQEGTPFRGYGCSLVVPLMGTTWNRQLVSEGAPVHVAACHGTALERDLFVELGGYDRGMILYGAGEPEFSIRAWLHGAEVVAVPSLEVQHRFKPRDEMSSFLSDVRPYWVHNCIRFALLYLSERGCLQVLRHFARASPHFQAAVGAVERSDVWDRRRYLEGRRARSFEWFVQRFGLTNQAGGPIV